MALVETAPNRAGAERISPPSEVRHAWSTNAKLALHIHTTDLAEVRSLIVKDGIRGQKIGENLVKKALEEASSLGIQRVLSLTYKQAFFERLGFVEIPKESLPEHKIWADCIKCKHFPICNEVSLIKTL